MSNYQGTPSGQPKTGIPEGRQPVMSNVWQSGSTPSPILSSIHRSQLPSLIPPGSRSGISRSIPTEVKGVKYNGDVEWGPFYSKFSTIAEYNGWCDAYCLFALSLTLEGVALKYFDILRRRGTTLTFQEVILRMEERFGQLPS